MMMASRPKIAFFKQGSFSYINQNIEQILRRNYLGHEVEVLDVLALLRCNRKTLVANIPWFVREYRVSLSKSLGQHRKNFYRTTYLFRQIKELVNNIVEAEEYLFSFQTQSLFDLSTPNVPHYVYTDHTILSNFAYPTASEGCLDARYSPNIIALEKTIYQNATMIFTMGDFVTKTLIKEYGCSPSKVLSVGGGGNLTDADPPTGLPVEHRLSGQPDYGAKSILFVGLTWERKGGPELATAFAQIRERHPTATLTIVGCEPEVNIPGCKVIGPVPLSEVQAYYKSASIFCMPSHREPFGIAYIEAQMNHLPVVATTVGAIPDIVRHRESGLLIAPGDQNGLVDALDKLLSDQSCCQRFGEAGYNHVREKYTWHAVGDALIYHINRTLPNDHALT